MTGRERWRGPFGPLGEIADSPTYDDLVGRWAGFERAARWFRRETYSYRRDLHGQMWNHHREHRSDIRDPALKRAMQEFVARVVSNPTFDDPRARDMRSRLIELMGVNWQEKPP
jgi:hypothetical protein